MQVDAVIVAAGGSTRFGETDKLAASLAGRPVLAWSLAAYAAAPSIDRLVVVTGADRHAWVRELAANGEKPGKSRYANRLVERILHYSETQPIDNLSYVIALVRRSV